MKNSKSNGYIGSMEALKKEKYALERRLREQEDELRRRVQQVPGEMFYSGMDSIIPSFLSGKVSSLALNAGKGLINNFFVRKAATAGGLKILDAVKPSGLIRRLGSAYKAVLKKK